MSFVLTKNVTITCGHFGVVTTSAGQMKLTVAQNGVLVSTDVSGKSVAGCQTKPDPNTLQPKICTICTVTGGLSSKLTVNHQPVLLSTMKGTTDGTALPVILTVNEPQTRLVAS